jgi:hypothetical protein
VSNTLKKINKKIAYSFVFILALLSAYLVHAQFSGDTVVVKTVNVFPAEIDAEGWSNAETLTFQNLGEYALLQDFNSINSATLRNSNSVKSGLVNEENQT